MSYELLLETILQSRNKTRGGDSPDVEFAFNDYSDATFSACENEFPDAWNINSFVHLTCVNFPKHENACIQGVDIDEIAKDLVGIGNANAGLRCGEAIFKFKEKHKLQTGFLKVFQAECIETRNHYL